MAFKGLGQEQAGAASAGWAFNPPPGWPAPPAGWQPPDGWQPDPSWPPPPPGWEFWKPAAASEPPIDNLTRPEDSFTPSAPAAAPAPPPEIRVTFDGRPYAFQPGTVVRVGRAPDNDVVVGEPSVSRKHAQLSWAQDGWVFENTGQAPTFLGGQTVTRVPVSQPVELTLGSPHGPVVRLEPAAAQAAQAPPGADWPGAQAAAPQASGWPGPQTASPQMADPRMAGPQMGGPQAAGPQMAGPGGWGAAGGWGAPGGARPGAPAAATGDELMAAFRMLIPIRSWLTNPGWRQGLRLMVIAYALLPLVFIALFSSSGDLKTPGWAYSLYVAPLWAVGFWLLIRPGPVKSLEIKVGIAIIVWTAIWLNVVTININDALVKSSAQGFSFTAALGVGYNEEITKALPILLAGLFLLKFRSTKLDPRMWMFLGTIAGLTFGVFEAALYTSHDLVIINQAQAASQAVAAVLGFAERVFVDGFQHAIWAGISCFFIGMAVNYRRRRIPLILLGVSISAILHALNDWSAGAFNSYWVWILIQAFSLFLFLGYTMSAESIVRQVRETPIFRGESMIMEAFTPQKEP